MTEIEAVKLILKELKRAEKLHPIWPKCFVRRASYLVEESAECLQAANSFEDNEGINHLLRYKNKMRTEAIHAGAMAIRFLINIDKE